MQMCDFKVNKVCRENNLRAFKHGFQGKALAKKALKQGKDYIDFKGEKSL